MLNEEEWKNEKDNYISKLKQVDETLSKFLNIDIGGFIDYSLKQNIEKIIDKNKTYLNKLEKDIFEVAIVGLEKAGKSSFANCLISSYVFPSADGRCTFTTTQLEFGNNEAIIEFYNINEFNYLFKNMLKEIEFEDYEKINFDTFDKNTFEYYKNILETTNPSLYNLHQATTIKDIEDIIIGKSEILKYLGQNNLNFKDNINKEVKSFITNPYISRTVKKIIIKSSELGDMKNAVIYDVPGFDSPTKIHKEQTLERLKNADAIILLNSLSDSPNIKGTHLEILHKNIDNDGIKLKEKLFVFGNKIDRQNIETKRNNFINIFSDDVLNKHKLVDKDKLFIGSSGAYLVSKNIPIDDENAEDAINSLKLFKYDNSIEKIKQALIEYYKTDRFNILKRKIDKNISDVYDICKTIIENNEKDFSQYDSRFIDNEIIVSLIENSRSLIKKEFSNLRIKTINDIKDERYFSKIIEERVLNGFKEISEEKYEVIRNTNANGVDILPSPEQTNIFLRKELYDNFKIEFENIVTDIANRKYEEIRTTIFNIFTKSLNLSKENKYFDEIIKGIENFIDLVTRKISYNPNSFVFLTERFSVDLFEILILCPIGLTDRKSKFEESKQNFYSLSLFYSNRQEDKPSYEQPLIKLLLTQKEDDSNIYSDIEIQNELIKEFELSDSSFKTNKMLYSKEIKEYSKYIYDKKIDTELVKSLVKKIALNGRKALSDNSLVISLIDTAISEIYNSLEKNDKKDNYIDNLTKDIKASDTKEKVLSEINTDINNLRVIFKDAVVKAIELEKPFISIVTKQIEALKNKVSPQDPSQDKDFSSFILKYASKIEYDKFDSIDKQKAIIENKKSILISMKKLLDNLNI